MKVTTETEGDPKGCLGCNREEAEAFLKAEGIDLSRFTEVPRPRHNWGDVLSCDECGRAWLISPQEETPPNEAAREAPGGRPMSTPAVRTDFLVDKLRSDHGADHVEIANDLLSVLDRFDRMVLDFVETGIQIRKTP